MSARWEHVATQVSALPRREFGRVLQGARPADRPALLRARFRHRVGEFAEWVMQPILARTTGWSPLTDFHRAVLTVPEPWDARAGIGMDLTLAPRGISKTTSKKIAALHALLYGYEAGIAVVCASHREALAWTRTVATWACEPEVTALYGTVGVEGTQEDLVVAGRPLWARGWSGSIRGLNRDGIRPTWIILDDIEGERNTRTERARDDTQADLASVIVPLGPSQGGHRIDWLATPAHHDAVAARVVRGEPGLTSWRARRFPAVVRWPDATEVWDEAHAIYADLSDGADPDERWARALAFLAEHPEATEGAVTVDPVRLPIEACYRRRWDVGELAWAREYEVCPTAPGEGLFCTDDWPIFAVDGDYIVIGRQRYPWRGLKRRAAWDPSEGGDDGGLAVLGREASGRCLILHSDLMGIRASQQVPRVVAACRQWELRELLVEQLTSTLEDALQAEARRQGIRLALRKVTQTRNKEIRLSDMEAPASGGLLARREDMPMHHRRKWDDFDPSRRDNADDLLDAVEMAYRDFAQPPARLISRPLA